MNGEGGSGMESTDAQLARIQEGMKSMDRKLDDLSSLLTAWTPGESSPFVSKDSFVPVQRVAYGMVGVVCTGFLIALVALVWQS